MPIFIINNISLRVNNNNNNNNLILIVHTFTQSQLSHINLQPYYSSTSIQSFCACNLLGFFLCFSFPMKNGLNVGTS